MSLDFKKLLDAMGATAHAFDAKVVLELDEEEQVGTYVMTDEDGDEVARVDVTDAGTYRNRQMMSVTDEDGTVMMEPFGDVLAKVMWA